MAVIIDEFQMVDAQGPHGPAKPEPPPANRHMDPHQVVELAREALRLQAMRDLRRRCD